MRTHWLTVLVLSVMAMSSCTGGGQTNVPSPSDLHLGSDVVVVRSPGTRGQRALSRFSTIYSFKGGADGASPFGLTIADGTLYGPTFYGGGSGCGGLGCGTVYALDPSGQKRILYAFHGGATGAKPSGA